MKNINKIINNKKIEINNINIKKVNSYIKIINI